jgi:outer membrane protein OmpA-like peptidoglycan-associated protein
MKAFLCITAVPLVLGLGCATTGPSQQLLDARQAYENARTSAAAEFRPDAVLTAQQALERAEQAHQEDAGSFKEQSLAYIAERKAQKAVAWGAYEADVRNIEQAEATYRAKQARLLSEAERDKEAANQSLENTQDKLTQQNQNLNRTQAELAEERKARLEADRRAAAAMASLEQVAKVKEEARGTVITLDGAVLFVTGKSELLPMARRKLDDVAKALKDIDEDQKLVIEGHTDSQGDDQSNMLLSRQRAEAVQQYLVSQGIKSDRIQAVGRGEAQPVAKNDSPEGRANNRRVEIIVQNATQPVRGLER